MSTDTAAGTRAAPAVDVSSRRPPPRRKHRRQWRALLLVSALMAGAAAVTGMALLTVRAEMTAAQRDVRRGTAALLAGDAQTAVTAFDRADEHATAAQLRVSAFPLRAVAFVPVARQQVRTAGALVSAAALVARAGREVAAGALDVDGGLASIAPSNGRFPVEPLRSVQPRLQRAADFAARAEDTVRDADHWLLVPQLRAERATALTELERAVQFLEVSAALADVLPSFLGADGAREYLFGAATPAELRGTGGLIGAYASLTARDGALSFGPFLPASQLPRAVSDIPPPPTEDYQRRYGEFSASGHWSNVNMTPDFPTAAVAIERLYARTVGAQVDGTVVADPFALQLLLQATGPAEVPGVGAIGPDTVVDYLTHDSYVELQDPQTRKDILGKVAVAVFGQFLHSDAAPQRKVQLLAEAIAGGHVLLHANDDDVQAAFVRADVAGSLLETEDDYVAVVANNAAGNKIDYFAERSLDYRVDLRTDGTAHGRLDVDVANTAPSTGLPAYVIGPSDDRFAPGENVMLLSTFCATSCRSDGYRVDGEPTAIGQHTELGRQVLPATVRVPAGETRELTYDWELVHGWDATDEGGTYRLTVQGQPTVRATRAALRIRVPAGMDVTRVTEGARVHGDEVHWTGTLGHVVRMEVTFTPRRSAWERLRAVLDQPLR